MLGCRRDQAMGVKTVGSYPEDPVSRLQRWIGVAGVPSPSPSAFPPVSVRSFSLAKNKYLLSIYFILNPVEV